MQSPRTKALFALMLVVALFSWGNRQAAAQDGQEPATSGALQFRPITLEEVKLAQQALRTAREEFRKATIDAKKIEGWETHLQLSKWCEADPASPAPIDELATLSDQLAKNTPGMEWPPLQTLRTSLLTFADRWRDKEDARLETKTNLRLTQIQSHLALPQWTSQQQAELATAAQWLARHGQAPELLTQLGERFRHSNFRTQIGLPLISSYMYEPIDRPEVVNDEILGTSVSGTGQAVGSANVELIPSPQHIAFDIVATVCVKTNTTAVSGPVCVYSNGATYIQSRKAVYFDGQQLSASPTRSTASTDSVTTGISTKFKRLANRLVTKIAEKEIAKKKDEGNATAASHAERDANAETDLDVNRIVAETNAEYKNEIADPLARRGFSLRHLLCSTSKSAFHIDLGAAGAHQLLAPSPPAEFTTNSDVQFQLHPTALSNAAAIYLAGDLLWLSDLAKGDASTKPTPENSADKSAAAPPKDRSSDVGIMLDSFTPITASFDDGEIRLVILGERFIAQSQEWPPMEITLQFRPQFTDHGPELVSTKEPIVFPPGKTRGLSGPEVTLRRILIDQLKKELAKPIPLKPLPITRDGRPIGNLILESAKTPAGWLEGGLKFIPVASGNAPR